MRKAKADIILVSCKNAISFMLQLNTSFHDSDQIYSPGQIASCLICFKSFIELMLLDFCIDQTDWCIMISIIEKSISTQGNLFLQAVKFRFLLYWGKMRKERKKKNDLEKGKLLHFLESHEGTLLDTHYLASLFIQLTSLWSSVLGCTPNIGRFLVSYLPLHHVMIEGSCLI